MVVRLHVVVVFLLLREVADYLEALLPRQVVVVYSETSRLAFIRLDTTLFHLNCKISQRPSQGLLLSLEVQHHQEAEEVHGREEWDSLDLQEPRNVHHLKWI